MARAMRVMIIDDVSTYRQILKMVINDFAGVECIGDYSDGLSGLKAIEQLQPDLVFLDIEMPVMNGLEVLKEVNKKYPKIGVIMVSGFDKKQADITIKALEMGAIDFIPKPTEASVEANIDILKKKIVPLVHIISTKQNLERIKQIAGRINEGVLSKDERLRESSKQRVQERYAEKVVEKVPEKKIEKTEKETEKIIEKAENAGEKTKEAAAKVIEKSEQIIKKTAEKQAKIPALAAPFRIDLVAIGISTGGPNALSEVIPLIPADFPVPILIVQHMPPNFTASLANSLTKKSKIPVYEAKYGDSVTAGKVLLAPGGYHMVVMKDSENKDRLIINITDAPPVHGCRPSVDVLFKSIVQNFSGNVLGVIMTGMGADGTDGIRTLKSKKCYCLIQDEESCVVFGMPKMILQNKLADEVVPLNELANRITEIVKLSKG